MKHKNLDKARCPIARSLGAIGDAWSLLIIRDAMLGKRRFGEFQKSLGMARNILAVRLRKLVSQGVMEVVPGEGAYHEYALTEKGRRLYPVIIAIRQWGERCLYEPGELESRLVDRANGEPIRELEVKASDGRVLNQGDTRVEEVRRGSGKGGVLR